MKIDAFCHIIPRPYPKQLYVHTRAVIHEHNARRVVGVDPRP